MSLHNQMLLTSINADTASAIASGEVTALAHEVRNHSVEFGGLVSDAGLASAKGTEVLSSLWDSVGVKLEGDAALCLAGNLDVEEYGGVLHGEGRSVVK